MPDMHDTGDDENGRDEQATERIHKTS